jgi:inosine-uridine nucleoside N-ribohydrolase
MTQHVILDVDPGSDDAVAILLAGHHPELDLVAVTVTFGNAPLPRTLENTLRTVEVGELAGVPVFPGATRPLLADPLPTDPVQRALLPLPPATFTAQTQRAVDFLVDFYLGANGPDTVYVPLGPQTNLALALRLEPRIAERIPRIVTMAGAYLTGNTTPSAEFNVLADPEAAHIVFNSGIPITMVGLEVTAQALVSLEDAQRIANLGTPWANAAAAVMEGEIRWFIDNLGWEGGQIYDACAVASVIDPQVLETVAVHLDIELHGRLTRGRTVADMDGIHGNEPNVDVGVGIDCQRFMQILFEGLN